MTTMEVSANSISARTSKETSPRLLLHSIVSVETRLLAMSPRNGCCTVMSRSLRSIGSTFQNVCKEPLKGKVAYTADKWQEFKACGCLGVCINSIKLTSRRSGLKPEAALYVSTLVLRRNDNTERSSGGGERGKHLVVAAEGQSLDTRRTQRTGRSHITAFVCC
jgi:hypothetical protein